MRRTIWSPPVELSPDEQAVVKLIRRAKLLIWLREHRHELFDEEFQAELAEGRALAPPRVATANNQHRGQWPAAHSARSQTGRGSRHAAYAGSGVLARL